MPRELLPELTSDILLRLPAKSLVRFRCLSNSICDEIGSSNFVEIHHKRSIETRSHRKLIIIGSTNFWAADINDGLREAIRFNIQFPDQIPRTKRIIGSCHGLFLLSVDSPNPDEFCFPDLFLWNPSIREFKKLPRCPDENPRQSRLCCGLGYDSASDDYKVVRIISGYQVLTSLVREVHFRVWVFSLKSNSWRRNHQDLDLNPNIHINSYPEGFANGFLYWPYVEGFCEKAACFDLANEEYLLTPGFCLPHDQVLKRPRRRELGFYLSIDVIEGNVVLRKTYTEDRVDEFYSIGAGGNWSEELLTFNPATRNEDGLWLRGASLLAYSKDRACVLFHRDKDIFWYNIEKGTMHRVQCLRSISEIVPLKCRVYFESLVLLGNDGSGTIFQVF